MADVLGLTAAEWTAVATVATTIVLLVSAGFAAWAVKEARTLRREQFRPWITVSFHFRSVIAFVRVENLGATVARDVRITLDPPLASTLEAARGPIAMLDRGIPQLAPGEHRLFLFDRVSDRLERDDLPSSHRVRVAYRDHRHRPLVGDEFTLDVRSLEGARLPDKGMHELVEAVQALGDCGG